jgi:hypothetical protein
MSEHVPFTDSTDVLVIGGGMAGWPELSRCVKTAPTSRSWSGRPNSATALLVDAKTSRQWIS